MAGNMDSDGTSYPLEIMKPLPPPPAPKPPTDKQIAARQRNWKRLQLKFAFWVFSGLLWRKDQALLTELRDKALATIDERWQYDLARIERESKAPF